MWVAGKKARHRGIDAMAGKLFNHVGMDRPGNRHAEDCREAQEPGLERMIDVLESHLFPRGARRRKHAVIA